MHADAAHRDEALGDTLYGGGTALGIVRPCGACRTFDAGAGIYFLCCVSYCLEQKRARRAGSGRMANRRLVLFRVVFGHGNSRRGERATRETERNV